MEHEIKIRVDSTHVEQVLAVLEGFAQSILIDVKTARENLERINNRADVHNADQSDQ